MATTASLRIAAAEFERRLDWQRAAECWEQAIACYPAPLTGTGKLDVAAMRKRAEACRGSQRDCA